WLSTSDWTRVSMLNIARMAWFSSDRTIGEYAQNIWKVPFERPGNLLGREHEKQVARMSLKRAAKKSSRGGAKMSTTSVSSWHQPSCSTPPGMTAGYRQGVMRHDLDQRRQTPAYAS